jgi:flagellar biosynthesis/type III secretory pathway protein FliH
MKLLSMYHINMKNQESLSEDDQELLMITLPAYIKWREEVLQQGLQQGLQLGLQLGLQQGIQAGKLLERRLLVENLLLSRFGTIDEALSPVIEALLPLSPLELSRLLTQLSRDELLAKFTK